MTSTPAGWIIYRCPRCNYRTKPQPPHLGEMWHPCGRGRRPVKLQPDDSGTYHDDNTTNTQA